MPKNEKYREKPTNSKRTVSELGGQGQDQDQDLSKYRKQRKQDEENSKDIKIEQQGEKTYSKKQPKKISKQSTPSLDEEIKNDHDESFNQHVRSEYFTRFEGVSTQQFNADPLKFSDTYFRSQYSRRPKDPEYEKTFKHNVLFNGKTKGFDKTGTFKSPFGKIKFATNKLKLPKDIEHASLYNEMLDFRDASCKRILDGCKNLDRDLVKVHHENNYPCLMVHIPYPHKVQTSRDLAFNDNVWNNLLLSYYGGIVNALAVIRHIPIEIVQRSSFGHFLPSLAETWQSFRINVGIVPQCYEKILIDALEILVNSNLIKLEYQTTKNFASTFNQQIEHYNRSKLNEYRKLFSEGYANKSSKIFNEKLKKSLEKEWKENADEENADGIYEKLITVANSGEVKFQLNIVKQFKESETLSSIMWHKAHFQGKSLLSEAFRQIEGREFLSTKVMEHYIEDKKVSLQPIEELLGHMKWTENSITRNEKIKNYLLEFKKLKFEATRIPKYNDEFVNLVEKILTVLKHEQIKNISQKNLYEELERAHLEFAASPFDFKDIDVDFGSDSDEEGDFEDKQKIYGKKLIVNTGIMAINLAYYTAFKMLNNPQVIIENMYYETVEAIKTTGLRHDSKKESKGKIVLTDINYCVNNGKLNKNTALANLNKDIIPIIDVTSATTTHIHEVVWKALGTVLVVFTVSSGLKNQQGGGDLNPYGTIRIFTRDKDKIGRIYTKMKGYLVSGSGSGSGSGHGNINTQLIRKSYKAIGMVPTNKKIFAEDL
ncbi:hypothetical protein [Vibrio spartinae]|uniref:Uncharacterized protein n=1 Tax=Vibrio spartinae TaxID=1918945 RepID=A0ABX6QZF1_9VIBR|nr:hypothetical protein [Vibrio spartinae]QMV14482.1 hypothetical protein Vspart_01738 [Vibrio spartinae]